MVEAQVELHLFTNCTANAPSTKLIETTYNSFCDTFNVKPNATVWIDRMPYKNVSDEYINNLKRLFPRVIETNGLADGYTRAVRESTADYLFMLEHDWVFTKAVTHSLAEIIDSMYRNKLLHYRFNKRKNNVSNLDSYLIECQDMITYCLSPSLSNNPHIIDRNLYIEKALPHVAIKPGSKGIEECLTYNTKLMGAIYGPIFHKAAVKHLDGRGRVI